VAPGVEICDWVENKGGVQFVLALDDSPGKDYAREITTLWILFSR
jgi:hypothetical protein